MQHNFAVIIDTDEATGDELEAAIYDALSALTLPNGDTLAIVSRHVVRLPPSDIIVE